MNRCVVMLLLAGGCRPDVVARGETAAPSLRRVGSDLYVQDVPSGLNRGALLIVMFAPALDVPARPLAVVQVTDRFSATSGAAVAPWGPCSGRALAKLDGVPLAVETLAEDTQLRVGKCWGRAEPIEDDAWEPGAQHIDLRITLGRGDEVQRSDRFEVLGPPIVSDVNRFVEDHEKIAECTVQPLELHVMHAQCRVDRTQWRGFTRERALQGAWVRFIPAPDVSTP